MIEVNKPIFIIGGGRSGTTVLYELLSMHPGLCWFSNLTNRIPRHPEFSTFHRVLDLPNIGDRLRARVLTKKKCVLRPSEAEHIYSLCGFDDSRKMTEQDSGQIDVERFRKTIASHLKHTRKARFLNKQTGNNQRITLIHKLFPEAHYVHIIRDGQAVANSFSNVPWWDDLIIWWNGKSPRDWEREGRSRIELCALHWKRELMEILDHKEIFDKYFDLRYEDLVQDTRGWVQRICEFSDLEWSSRYERLIPKTLQRMNYKWQESLSADEKAVLNDTIGDLLQDLGYYPRGHTVAECD